MVLVDVAGAGWGRSNHWLRQVVVKWAAKQARDKAGRVDCTGRLAGRRAGIRQAGMRRHCVGVVTMDAVHG